MASSCGGFSEADIKRKEEAARAAKISKVVESASPGATVHVVSRQVNSYLSPWFSVEIVIFCSQKA